MRIQRGTSLLCVVAAALLVAVVSCERRDPAAPETAPRPADPAYAPDTTPTPTPAEPTPTPDNNDTRMNDNHTRTPGVTPGGTTTAPGTQGPSPGERQQAQEERFEEQAERREFIASARQSLAEMDRRTQVIEGRIAELGAHAPQEAQEALTKLRQQRQAAAQALSRAEQAPPDEWGDARDTTEEAVSELENRYNELLETLQVDE